MNSYKNYATNSHNIYATLRLRNPNILAASATHTKTGLGGPAELIQPEGYPDGVRMRLLGVDEDFLGTYGIHLVEGRNFDTGRASDRTAAFILNETAVRQLGWDKPIGMQVTWGSRKGQVIGVVRDFHNRSLHEEIGPVVLAIRQDVFNTLVLRLANGDLIATINDLERIWHKKPSENLSCGRPRPLDSRFRGNDGIWSLARLNATQGGFSDSF